MTNSLLKNVKKTNGTPACAGVTGKVENYFSTKTIVMPAEAGIPFSFFASSESQKQFFSRLLRSIQDSGLRKKDFVPFLFS